MKEELISFETAKLAKEKGFDKKGYNFYQIEGEIFINEIEAAKVNSHYYSTFPPFELYKNHNINPLWCSAPTQSLLQKWLREIHDIDVTCTPVRFTGYVEVGYFTYTVRSIQPVKNYRFDKWEEALEAGLIEGLKLIE